MYIYFHFKEPAVMTLNTVSWHTTSHDCCSATSPLDLHLERQIGYSESDTTTTAATTTTTTASSSGSV